MKALQLFIVNMQVALVTFATYSLINLNNPNERLTADKAFVALSLFEVLRFPLAILPLLISNMVQATVSVKRLSKFLMSEELDPNIVEWEPERASGNLNIVMDWLKMLVVVQNLFFCPQSMHGVYHSWLKIRQTSIADSTLQLLLSFPLMSVMTIVIVICTQSSHSSL